MTPVTPVTPTVTPARCSRLPHGLAYSSHTLGVTQGHARLRLTASYKEQDAREGLGHCLTGGITGPGFKGGVQVRAVLECTPRNTVSDGFQLKGGYQKGSPSHAHPAHFLGETPKSVVELGP